MAKIKKQLKSGKKYNLIFENQKIPVCYVGENGLTKKMYEFACRRGSKKEGVIETITIPKEDIKIQKKLEVIIKPITLIHEHFYHKNICGRLAYSELNKELNKVGI